MRYFFNLDLILSSVPISIFRLQHRNILNRDKILYITSYCSLYCFMHYQLLQLYNSHVKPHKATINIEQETSSAFTYIKGTNL